MGIQRWHIHEEEVTVVNYSSVPRDKRLEIVEPLIALTSDGFLRFQLDQEIVEDVLNHVTPAPRLMVVYNGSNTPVAFTASDIFTFQGVTAYYLGGIIVRSDYQHSGLAYRLLRQELESTGAKILALQTQSGHMLGLMKKFVVLDPQLSKQLAELHRSNHQPGIISKGIYRKGYTLYDDIQRLIDEGRVIRQEDLIFLLGNGASEFDWKQGDALFVAGHVCI